VNAALPARPSDAVRILHTSDWHLGAKVRNEPRRADHEALIAEIVEVARAASPDLVVHTGDLFDGERPPMQDFGLAISALRALSQVAPVVLLAGNHDSPVALEVLALAVQDAPVRVHARPTVAERGAVTTYPTRTGGVLRLVALPFVHQNRVLREFGDLVEANATYNDSLRKIVASYSGPAFDDFDPTADVAVFASHVHVRDARTSSEKVIHIAEDYATDPAHFEPRYGYLAFGHIHVPQAVADGRGRYAGSILEVDFGEEGEQKQVVVVDLVPGRPTSITPVALTAGRRLHRLRAPLSALATHATAIGAGIVEVTVLAEDAPTLALDLGGDTIVVDGQPFDTLSAAVHAQLPAATVVGVVDGRNPSTVSLDEIDVPTDVRTLGDTFRSWLVASGGSVLANTASGAAEPGRVAGMFDELHAAVTADAATDLPELAALAQLEEQLAPAALVETGSAD